LNEGQFSEPVDAEDKAAFRKALTDIADMIDTAIETGRVESLAVLYIGPSPKGRPDSLASLSSRYLVRVEHLDFMQDLWHNMIKDLSAHHGVTPEQVRADRLQSSERIEKEGERK
jgi:hypothetical protein